MGHNGHTRVDRLLYASGENAIFQQRRMIVLIRVKVSIRMDLYIEGMGCSIHIRFVKSSLSYAYTVIHILVALLLVYAPGCTPASE